MAEHRRHGSHGRGAGNRLTAPTLNRQSAGILHPGFPPISFQKTDGRKHPPIKREPSRSKNTSDKTHNTSKKNHPKTIKTPAPKRRNPKQKPPQDQTKSKTDQQEHTAAQQTETTSKNHQQKTKTTAKDVNPRFTDILHHEWCFAA
uniref:hypothetical protein n=1 Tax=Bifidobacterium adolescentis TaxID=1680 RepID=UPI00359C5472